MLTILSQSGRDYWVDMCLLTGVVAVTIALTIVHLIDRRKKRLRNGSKTRPDQTDYERPPFTVDYGSSGAKKPPDDSRDAEGPRP